MGDYANATMSNPAKAEAFCDERFEKKLEVALIKRDADDVSTTYEVENNYIAYLCIFLSQLIWPFVVGVTTEQFWYWGITSCAFVFLMLAWQTPRRVRREGENIVIVLGNGSKTIPITNIRSLHLGYKSEGEKCCRGCCSIRSKFLGEALKPLIKTVAITLKAESADGCDKTVGVLLTVKDCDAFLKEITDGGESSFEVVVK